MKEIKFFNGNVIKIIDPKKELQLVRGRNANFVWFDGDWFDLSEDDNGNGMYIVELL